MGHRITAVHAEIEQHLLDLTGIGHDRREIFIRRGHNSYRRTEEPAQHLLHVTHALVEAERLGVERLAAAECEKLAGQRTRAVARLDDLIYLTGPTRLLAKILAENVGVAHDCGQQVVEVVGDSPRQAPQRIELLSLPQLMLEQLS